MQDKELTRLLDRAKIGLMGIKNSTFISTILFSLKFSWDSNIPTACTDGLSLKFNPDFFRNMSEEERIGVLAHEAWHVAFQHMLRVGDRDFGLWNQATDHVINLMLLSKGYQLPRGGLADPKFENMNSDEVYTHLDQNKQDQSPNFQQDMAPAGGNNPGTITPEEAAKVEQKITDTILKATLQSRVNGDDPGTIPGEIERELHKLLYPKLPWNIILQRFMNDLAPLDFTWRRPNKRFMPEVYLPTLYSETIGHIAIAVDTSGSVTDEQFTDFLTEINSIKEHLQPERLTVIDFDTCIQHVHELGKEDSVHSVKFTGRGGTHIGEVLEWADTHKPLAMVIFTDGYFRKVDLDPGIPIIWIIHSDGIHSFKTDFGKVVEYPH